MSAAILGEYPFVKVMHSMLFVLLTHSFFKR